MAIVIRAARLSNLLDLLRAQGVVSTTQLADELGVSVVTIRRDLDVLAEEGYVERVFGGARLWPDATLPITVETMGETETVDEPFEQVLARNSEGKKRIARRAASLVEDGETVFLDVGTTCHELARSLTDRTITVITASLSAVDLLSRAPGVDLVLLGGEYNREYRCTQGSTVSDALSALQVDRAFLGCAGISDRALIRDTDTRQVAVKRAAIRVAGTTAVLVDASKLPGTGAFIAGDVTDLDHLITDADLDTAAPALAELLAHASTEVLTP